MQIDKISSEILPINLGVPQGSNLGPLLFLVYINDISNLNLYGSPVLFADDTALFYSCTNSTTIIQNMASDLKKIKQYFDINLLTLNHKKTNYLLFYTKNKNVFTNEALKLGDDVIEKVTFVKYLGIYLDSQLNWKVHIDSLCRKLISQCGALRKLSYHTPKWVLEKIYFAHFHSRLQYLISAWGSAAKTNLSKLQVLQNRALKSVYKLPYLFPTSDLYTQFNKSILPVKGLNELQLLSQLFKILKLNSLLSNLAITRRNITHSHNTRQANDLCVYKAKKEMGKRCFTYIAPYMYNKLPDTIKNLANLKVFKIEIISHIKRHIECYI